MLVSWLAVLLALCLLGLAVLMSVISRLGRRFAFYNARV